MSDCQTPEFETDNGFLGLIQPTLCNITHITNSFHFYSSQSYFTAITVYHIIIKRFKTFLFQTVCYYFYYSISGSLNPVLIIFARSFSTLMPSFSAPFSILMLFSSTSEYIIRLPFSIPFFIPLSSSLCATSHILLTPSLSANISSYLLSPLRIFNIQSIYPHVNTVITIYYFILTFSDTNTNSPYSLPSQRAKKAVQESIHSCTALI